MRLSRIGLALLTGVLLASTASAQVLYDNGTSVAGTGLFGIQTSVGDGFGGANQSTLFNPPDTTLGFGFIGAVRLSDNFTIPAGQTWQINSVSTFGYQTQAVAGVPPTPFLTGTMRILNAAPNTPFIVLAGDDTTNVMTSSVFSNIFRVTPTTQGGGLRAVFQNTMTFGVAPILGPGTYWIDFNHTTGGAGTGFGPPITIIGAGGVTGDAFQSVTGAAGPYAAIVQGGSGTAVGLPFLINGTIVAVPEPATIAFIGLAIAGGGVAYRKRKQFKARWMAKR